MSCTCASLLLADRISDFGATLSYIRMPQLECILVLWVNAPKPISGAFTQNSDGSHLVDVREIGLHHQLGRLLMFRHERPMSQPVGTLLLPTCQIKTLAARYMTT